MLDGGFFTGLQSFEQFVILSETLVWKLFGDFHAAGKTVLVGQAEYKVLGVARQQNPVDYAWLPLAALGGSADKNAGSLHVMPKPYNKINGYRTCEELLGLAGINRFDYRITDLNEYIGSIARRPLFALSLFYTLAAIGFHKLR